MSETLEVKIGASDAGLEATLKTVQAELSNMESKVKSGDLSMGELEKTMKRMGQVQGLEQKLKAMGSEAADASPKLDALGKDIKGTGDKSEKMGEQSGVGFGKLVAAVGVGQLAAQAFTAAPDASFAAVQGAIKGFTDALNLGGTLADLSASTGESAGNLLLLQRAFDNTGSGADAVGPALAKLQNNIFGAGEDSKSAAAAFGRMGVSMEDMAGKTPTEQLALVASGISSIEDPTTRAATAIDIFGKSGAQLLPLLTNFSGEMDEARATVGSLADIMDRRANVFDAVGDRFLIIQQKVRDFAAGILDKALPAIDAITSALSRIDAAAIGQNLANAFLGGQNAMKGFQAAVDAISIGQVGLAFKVFWESLKLQSMQTADSIYKNLAAGFQSAADFFAKIFTPSGSLFQTTVAAFDFLANKLSVTISRTLANAFSGNSLTEGIALQLNKAANEANTAANKIEDSLTGAGGRIAEQFKQAGAALPQSFQDNYSKIPPLFDGITEQQSKVAALEAEVAVAAAKTTEERAAQSAQTDAELAKRQALKDAQADADAEAKASKAELITLETAVNEAKAAGNTELAKSLEQELQSIKAKEEIAKLTEEYVKTLGVDANEAERLAKNFVNAKNAVDGITGKSVNVSVTTTVSDKPWRDLLASLDATPNEKTITVSMEVTGTDNLVDARNVLSACESKNVTAAFETTGVSSLEELSNKINGIPNQKSVTAALEITGEEDLDTALGNLQRFGGTKNTKLVLEKYGFENLTELSNQINGVPDTKTAKVAAEAFGLEDVSLLNNVLDTLMEKNGKSVSVTASVDTAAAMASIASLYESANTTFASPVALNLEGDQSIAAVRASAEGNFAAPIAFNLDGDKTIQDVRIAAEANFANPIALTMSGSQAANDVYSTVSSAFGAPVTLGVNADTSTAQTEVASLGTPQTLTLSADTTGAQAQVATLGTAQTLTLNADIAPAAAKVATLSDPISVQIDSNQVQAAVASMQADISNSFTGGTGGDGGLGGNGGQGGEGGIGGDATADVSSITDILNDWTNILTTIRDRLPQFALGV